MKKNIKIFMNVKKNEILFNNENLQKKLEN